MFALPIGMQFRTRMFGAKVVSPLFPVPVQPGCESAPRPLFEVRWEDPQLGRTVLVREQQDGHLIADVFAADSHLLNEAAVSVSLVGTAEDQMILKMVPLVVAEKNGCSGSADFGPLANAVQQLGSQLGVIVFLLLR